MRKHAETITVRIRKPHLSSAYVSTNLCHCATILCAIAIFVLLLGILAFLHKVFGQNASDRGLAAAVIRDQKNRFSNVGGPLEFVEWTQKRHLVRYCSGKYEAYGNLFARLFDVTVRPSLAVGPPGGESITEVLNRAESDEYLKLKPGFFSLSCPTGARNLRNPFLPRVERASFARGRKAAAPRSFLSEFHLATEFSSSTPAAAKLYNTTVFALTRYEYANFFHTTTYLYNAFLTSKAIGVACDEAHVVFIDAHAQSPLDDVWKTLFRNVTRVKLLPEAMRLRELIWLPLGYGSPLMNEALRKIPLLEEFRDFFLAKHGVSAGAKTVVAPASVTTTTTALAPAPRRLDCMNVTVTMLFRCNYVAHPRNPTGTVPRRIQNEAELLAETEKAFRNAGANVRLNVRGLAFESLDMREQLTKIVETDILIGMHGAGLTHILFLPKHAAVIEMFLRGSRASHYEAFARWRALRYKFYQNKNSKLQMQDSLYIPPQAISVLIDTLLTEMKCCSKSCIKASTPS